MGGLIQSFLSCWSCTQVGYLAASDGKQFQAVDSSLYRVVAIHPTSPAYTHAAIKEFFGKLGYRVVDLKETFDKDFGYFLSVRCIDSGNHYEQGSGMYAEVVSCSVQDRHTNSLVYKGSGQFNYLVQAVKNYHVATMAALQNFSLQEKPITPSIASVAPQTLTPSAQRVRDGQQTVQTNVKPEAVISTLQMAKPIVPSHNDLSNVNNPPKRALLIGNADYQYISALTNPKNDAADLANKLKRLGFSVTLLLNASQQDMDDAIHQFGRQLIQDNGVGLFFYAGHGVQVSGQNYLIPVDANVVVQKDVKYKAVHLGMIMDAMDEARNNLNIIILDACRNNPLPVSSRTMARGLAQVNGPQGAFIAFATAPGETASDGEGRNGTYTKYLLKNIDAEGASLEKVFKNVAKGVAMETNNKQRPWINSSFIGDFYFVAEK